VTTFRVRAIPFGAAVQLTRRALALGPDRFTHRRVLEPLADWWKLGELPLSCAGHPCQHPFTFVLDSLENPLT